MYESKKDTGEEKELNMIQQEMKELMNVTALHARNLDELNY